jgi:hypothetical protein
MTFIEFLEKIAVCLHYVFLGDESLLQRPVVELVL